MYMHSKFQYISVHEPTSIRGADTGLLAAFGMTAQKKFSPTPEKILPPPQEICELAPLFISAPLTQPNNRVGKSWITM